jgi:DNA-directed RNA polymerase specialized sigma24 family protein
MNTAVTFAPPAKPAPHARVAALLSDRTWLARIERVVKQRVPDREAAADIVQEACADAVAHAGRLPDDDAEAKKYLFGIVRNKVRMHIRARTRAGDSFDEEIHGERAPAPGEEQELLRKIVGRIPATRWPTLTWFVRVTMGDSLADIAREAGVDYATAHARYARMRTELRQHAMQLAAVAAVVALVFGIGRVLRPRPTLVSAPNPYARSVVPAPSVVPALPVAPANTESANPEKTRAAAELRHKGLASCEAHRWTECLDDLDRARDLDAPGDVAPEVQDARRAASKATTHEKR